MSANSSRFAQISRPAAWAVLAAGLALAIWSFVTAFSMGVGAVGHQAAYDLEFFRQVVAAIHQGHGYYEAFDAGFTSYGFETKSMFNWRQPTLAILIGSSPEPNLWHWVLLGLSFASVLCAAAVFLRDRGSPAQLLGVLLLLGGAFSWAFCEFDSFLTTEPWCEALLLLSLCAYARGWWQAGFAATVLALSLRELVMPYCVIALAFALWNRRRTEVVLWIAALALYVFLMSLHAHEIARRHPSAPTIALSQWLRPPRLQFVLTSCAMNAFLRPLPPQIIAIYLPLALIGLAGWRGQIGARLALVGGAYVIGFLFINAGEYWGYMYSSVLVLGAIRSPLALRDLWKSAVRKTS